MYYAPYGLNPYLAYKEAFILPTGISGNGTQYKSSTTEQYEIGVKYIPSWIDGSASLALFKARDKGALISNNTGATVNSDEPIKRKGIELQAEANLTDNLSGQFAYTYLSSITDPAQGSAYRMPLMPKHTASLRGIYSFTGGKLDGLSLGAGVRYVGTSYTAKDYSLVSNGKVPSSTVFDLFARYRFAKNWEAQLNIDNVSDRKYIAACDNYCYYGQGRSILGSLSFKF